MWVILDLSSHEIVDWDSDHDAIFTRAMEYSLRTGNPCQIDRVY